MPKNELPRDARLKLMGFICSFAWADLQVADDEKNLVRRMMKQLALEPDEVEQVEAWLQVPPRAEDVDPNDIPAEHRHTFLSFALQMVGADGVVDQAEMENLSLLEQLLR